MGDDGERIEGIHADTPLKAAPCFPTEQPSHLALFNQVVDALVDMGEPVDLLSRQMGPSGHDIFELGPEGQFVSLGHSFHRRTDSGMIDDILYPLAEHVDNHVQLPQTLLVCLWRNLRLDPFS